MQVIEAITETAGLPICLVTAFVQERMPGADKDDEEDIDMRQNGDPEIQQRVTDLRDRVRRLEVSGG